ncbi:uncharacterized protein LOC135849508 [Planococcus citri]|uniref:uncharacterized protein LOC135849508 n=1 Tax=Planococcus citri TaxID=170843 RepID=UPI0031F9BD65
MESSTSMVCPVCSLYLREGISLKSHLQTHSKDKVIEALLNKQISDGATSDTDALASVIRDSTPISLSSENGVKSHGHNTLSVLPTPTYVQAPNQSSSALNCSQSIPSGIQYMPTLGNNVISTQTMVGNSCQSNLTYQQFVTNDGNIVLIPMYTPQPPVMVSNNYSCIVVPPTPANNVAPVTVLDAGVTHDTARIIVSPPCVTLLETSSCDLPNEGSSPPHSSSIVPSPTNDYENENDAEVADIFQMPAATTSSVVQRVVNDEAVQSTATVMTDVDIDDKSSCLSYDHVEEDRNIYSVVGTPFSSRDYENDSEPSPDISIIKLHTDLNYENENSDYSPEPEAEDSLKSDEGEFDRCEHSYGKSSKPLVPIIDSKTFTSPIHSPAPMEDSHRNGQFDFIVSNSDNATHILPHRLDESGTSTSKNYEKDRYILPNNDIIPRTSPVNTDYSFIGLRSSFSTSASLISFVNKTVFADVDVYAVEKNDNANDFYTSQQKTTTATEEEIRENYKGINELLLDSAGSSRISPFDIRTDESMPARGELSGQESLSGTENSIWELQVQRNSYAQECNVPFENENADMKIELRSLMTEINIKMDADAFRNVQPVSVVQDSKLVVQKLFKKKVTREFRCFFCKDKFETWKSRHLHISNVHAEQDGLTIEFLFGKKVKLEEDEDVAKLEEDDATDSAASNEIITCRICSENVSTSVSFLEHLRFVHGIKRRNCVCPTCLVDFGNLDDYQEHIQRVHPYECMTCGKKFHTRPGYMLHQKRHMKVKPYGCDVCDKSFVTKQKLVEHINVHTGESPIKCDMCDSTFRRYSNYQQHKKFLHMNTKRKLKDFICDCGDIFHSKTKLLWHREIHDAKPKQCPFCVERFIHTASLTRHVRKWHNENYLSDLVDKKKMKNVVCPVCNITCLHTSLQTHMKIHQGVKPFSCCECSKTFRTKWNLQLHRWTHMSRSSKPFKCKLCVKAYIHKTDYDAHLRSHSNCRPYSCNVCGRQFIRKYNCIRHMREHKEPRSYECNICQKMFSRSYYLSEHLKTHTGEKPHTCHVCGKTSATKSNHNKHVKMHNNIRESLNTEG